MSVSRANLIGGPGSLTWNSGRFFTDSDLLLRMNPTLKEVIASMYGKVDKVVVDRVIKIQVPLWGAWELLPTLFPSTVLNPVIGTRIFGTTDLPLVIQGKNSDVFTFANAQLTKLADLYLGAQAKMFAAAAEFTCLIKNNTQPEAANAYYTASTSAYSEATAAFAKTNYKQTRFSAAWGAVAGFTAFQAQSGWQIGWNLDLRPQVIDGVGTVDMILMDFMAQAKCKPLEPTITNIEATNGFQGTPLGTLLSNVTNDLVITGAAGPVITLKNASITESGYAFGAEPLRIGEIVWETTVGFAAGVPGPRAVVA